MLLLQQGLSCWQPHSVCYTDPCYTYITWINTTSLRHLDPHDTRWFKVTVAKHSSS